MDDLKKYNTINKEYIEKIAGEIDGFLFASKKWVSEDYLWPFSDFDYRIVLKNGNKVDFFRLNEILYSIQLKMQTDNPKLCRILEHPPGYLFFESEIMTNYLEDFRIWSFAGGDFEKFARFRGILECCNDFDMRYYQQIIKKRYQKFSFKTEYRDYRNNLAFSYDVYCVLWHYYFPCIFAIQSLKERKSKGRKIHEEFLNDVYIINLFQRLREGSCCFEEVDIPSVVAEVEKSITDALIGVEFDKVHDDNSVKLSFFEALGMLRTRIARLRLYLEPDQIDRHYLVEREIIELNNIFSSLYQFVCSEQIKEALTILHLDITEEARLQELLHYLYNHRTYYNDFMNCEY